MTDATRMTSLDRRNDVSHEEAAVPGEVRRWRAFSLLAVAFFMTIVDADILTMRPGLAAMSAMQLLAGGGKGPGNANGGRSCPSPQRRRVLKAPV